MSPRKIKRPAAQYVRMSTDTQEYSIENQKEEIRHYADRCQYEIVQTYSDVGKTGVTMKHRPGLKQLLSDVLNDEVHFEAILVYDVSRWGRFQDDNEAAHYEFLCKKAGIVVHYCAEQFTNDGTLASGLLKNIKRIMAKEYSRELGVKTYAGQERIARMGFKIGGAAGFGLRRVMLSRDGRYKRALNIGEFKSLKTDRVKLAPGPKSEVRCVRRMFSMALRGMGCSDIAHALNRRGIRRENGRCWNCEVVRTILGHPKYTGCSVWGQSSQKLHTASVPVPRERWVMRPGAFPGIIDMPTFSRVQERLKQYAANPRWSDEEILRKLKRLWSCKGKLSESLIDNTTGMPSYSTIQKRFGSLRRAYDLIGYDVGKNIPAMCLKKERMFRLKSALIQDIQPSSLALDSAQSRMCFGKQI
jgi:DNA invertase Pin-like site-specific DNA recombinase